MIKEIVDTYPHMTDIHMTEGEKVVIRVNGILQRIDEETSPDFFGELLDCLLYTSPSPRDAHESRMPSSA